MVFLPVFLPFRQQMKFAILRIMKKRISVAVLLLVGLLIVTAVMVWQLKFAGVTHEKIYETMTDESAKVQAAVDDRYRKLDRKLDRIEDKLDRLLEIAERPPADGVRQVR